MNEKITTAEELDALPVGSVVRDRDRDEWTKRATPPVWVTPETRPFGSEDVARKWAPLTLVSRPDASTAVVVKRFGDYDLALNVDGSVTWRDTGRVPVLHDAPAPAAEDREALARLLRDTDEEDSTGGPGPFSGEVVPLIDVVAAVLAEHRHITRQVDPRPLFDGGPIRTWVRCACGADAKDHAEHQADMLAAAGLLVTPEHDAQVAARALREAAETYERGIHVDSIPKWLRDMAHDRIERQEGGR